MPEMDHAVFVQVRHWMWAIDPVHVGIGRQLVSRIDMPVVREQGTQLPILPGTSLAGVCRAYAALTSARNGLACAGQGSQDGEGHCGRSDCPVCLAFGYSKDHSKQSRQGLVQISTAHILFFPIASQYGPVWITCARRLEEAGLQSSGTIEAVASGCFIPVRSSGGTLPLNIQSLALGWLNLKCQPGNTDVAIWRFPGVISGESDGKSTPVEFQRRLGPVVIVDDALFGTLVNDNMEVRTLVSINPDTGAAKDGALYTYEAIPRGALLWSDVVFTDPAIYGNRDLGIGQIRAAVGSGFKLMKFLGTGGMNTRGLGRIEAVACSQ